MYWKYKIYKWSVSKIEPKSSHLKSSARKLRHWERQAVSFDSVPIANLSTVCGWLVVCGCFDWNIMVDWTKGHKRSRAWMEEDADEIHVLLGCTGVSDHRQTYLCLQLHSKISFVTWEDYSDSGVSSAGWSDRARTRICDSNRWKVWGRRGEEVVVVLYTRTL